MRVLVRRRVSVWPVCALLLCVLSAFLWSSGQLNHGIRELDTKYEQGRVKLTQLQNEQAELKRTLELAGTDSFIENQARSQYGYMKQDEVRFVITNPEALYGAEGVPDR